MFVILGWIPLIALANGPLTIGKFLLTFITRSLAVRWRCWVYKFCCSACKANYLVANGLDRRDALIDWIHAHVSMERGLLVGLIFSPLDSAWVSTLSLSGRT